MSQTTQEASDAFVDRRGGGVATPPRDRRQFSNSHETLSPDARELGEAIDEYKLHHRRRFITYEEIMAVVKQLGYQK